MHLSPNSRSLFFTQTCNLYMCASSKTVCVIDTKYFIISEGWSFKSVCNTVTFYDMHITDSNDTRVTVSNESDNVVLYIKYISPLCLPINTHVEYLISYKKVFADIFDNSIETKIGKVECIARLLIPKEALVIHVKEDVYKCNLAFVYDIIGIPSINIKWDNTSLNLNGIPVKLAHSHANSLFIYKTGEFVSSSLLNGEGIFFFKELTLAVLYVFNHK